MVRFVGAFRVQFEVIRLRLGQAGQARADPFQVQAGDLFIQMLRQHADLVVIVGMTAEQFYLGQHLIGKGIGHHKARVSGGAAQIHQAAFGQQDNTLAVRENNMINLGLDLFPVVFFQAGHIDLVVKVADVADDGLVFHTRHVIPADDIEITGRRDEDIGLLADFVHPDNTITLHSRLQGADRIDLGDPYGRPEAAQGLGGTLADIAIAQNHGDLAGHHHIGGALDAVNQRFTATIEVVKFGLGHGIIDIDRRERQRPLCLHLVQTLHPGRGFFGHAPDIGQGCANKNSRLPPASF